VEKFLMIFFGLVDFDKGQGHVTNVAAIQIVSNRVVLFFRPIYQIALICNNFEKLSDNNTGEYLELLYNDHTHQLN
jgi:hypothetical protein